MPDKGDIEFTFGASGFKKFSNEVGTGLKNIHENTKKMTDKISKGTFAGMTKAGLLVEALKKGIGVLAQTVNKYVPEIGQTFQIAGNIIAKNILWPLRQALIPILQKVLDWVRVNRKMFAELGIVIVNAFKMVKGIFDAIYNMLSPVIEEIKAVIKSIFGDTAKSIMDTMNLVMIKVVIFSMMVSNFLRPVFEGIAEVLKGVINGIKVFFEGVAQTFMQFFDKTNLLSLVEKLKTTFFSLSGALKGLEPVFRVLGKVIGVVFAGALNLAIDQLKIMLDTLRLVYELIDPKTRANAFKRFGESIAADVTKGGTASMIQKFSTEKVDDAIIKPNGQVIRTNPADTIIATKTPGLAGGVTVVIQAEGWHLTVTEGNAARAGENVVRGMENQMKNTLLNTLAVEGAS